MIFSMSKINKNIKRLQDKGYPVKSILDIIQNDNNIDTIVYIISRISTMFQNIFG